MFSRSELREILFDTIEELSPYPIERDTRTPVVELEIDLLELEQAILDNEDLVVVFAFDADEDPPTVGALLDVMEDAVKALQRQADREAAAVKPKRRKA